MEVSLLAAFGIRGRDAAVWAVELTVMGGRFNSGCPAEDDHASVGLMALPEAAND